MKTRNYFWIIICLIVSSSFGGHSQENMCQGLVLLVPRHQYVMLYASPDGEIKDSIIYDTLKNDYDYICIKQIRQNYAEIRTRYAYDTTAIEGWIQLKYLGINSVPSSLFHLYTYPDRKSAIMDSIAYPQWGDLYPILQCKDDWLYIRTFNNGSWREGWMAPEDQCPNPYFSCSPNL